MKNNLVINDANFTRTKKKLKKSLEKEGISLPLSKIGEILADSLGFQNTFDIQKNLLNIEESTSLSKKYLDDIIYILEEFSKYLNYDMPKIHKKLENIKYTFQYRIEHFIEMNRFISIKNIYLRENYDDILTGAISNIEDDNLSTIIGRTRLAFLRNSVISLYKLTGRRVYRDFYQLMDDYHNIESYYFMNTEARKTFWIKPVMPTHNDNYWLPNYEIDSQIKFNLHNVINEITDDDLNSLSKIPLSKNIIIFGKTGVGKTTAIDAILKNNAKHNQLVELKDSTEFLVLDNMDYKQEKEALHNNFKQKTILSLYAESYSDLLHRLVAENFDFENVGIIIGICRTEAGSVLYSVDYDETKDISVKNLKNWLEYIKNKK